MTSSLVGSEMCIRDSPTAQAAPCSTKAKVLQLDLSEVHGADTGSNRIGTVSYTHLTLPTICSV
eukprot:7939700-Prorocentrum_lima.AAC.1